jgi:serine/threonine protein kinase
VEDQQKKIGTITKKDFQMLSVIGKGSYGKVLLVKKADSGELYALKVLKKTEILKRNQVEHTMTERRILGSVRHPFIVKMDYAFQSEQKLFFVLEYCPGGELFFYLS